MTNSSSLPPAMPVPPTPISIWHPRIENGSLLFVRPEPHPLGDHYAATRVIRAAKTAGKRRLCFFGESAAAGYGFAPHLTPAQVLAHQLAHRAGDHAYEVIDLARTNESLAGLRHTVEAAMQLAPDMLVIFAGNNWNLLETPLHSPYAPTPAARQAFGEALAAEGLWGPINRAARERFECVAATLVAIRTVAAQADIPVVLVIPEVNRLDWETRQPVSWLATPEVMRWHGLLRAGERALRRADWGGAVQIAHQLLALDDGTCPTGYRVLVQARVGQGREQDARDAARAEADSVYYPALGFLAAPQITALDQELLRHLAKLWGWEQIDLPALFAGIPHRTVSDRALFLDYCHLTEEGIRLTMAAVSQATLRRFQGNGGTESSLFDPAEYPIPPLPAQARAMAYFGTALHSAHRLVAGGGRKAELLDYWCTAALDTDPNVANAMMDVVEARLSGLPALLTTAQQHNLTHPFRLQFQHGWEYDYLDATILAAIERALASGGNNPREKHTLPQGVLSGRRSHRHSAITHPFYTLEEPLEQLYPDLLPHDRRHERAYFRAAWHRTSFALIFNPEERHVVEVIVRLPRLPGQPERPAQNVGLRLNGLRLGTIRAGVEWQRVEIVLPPHHLQPGMNRLTFLWPPLPPLDTSLTDTIVEQFKRGEAAELHPLFGEIYAFRVRSSI